MNNDGAAAGVRVESGDDLIAGFFDGSADHSGADLRGLTITASCAGRRLRPKLSGSLMGANLSGARISGADITSDCSHMKCEGAEITCCQLLGKFDHSLGIGRALNRCIIDRGASLNGTDLSGLRAGRVAARTGNTIQVLGKKYELLQPAQCVPWIKYPGSRVDSNHPKQLFLDSALVVSPSPRFKCLFWPGETPALYDVAGLATELRGTGAHDSGGYFLYAPGITIQGFNCPVGPALALRGNYDGAILKDSEIFAADLRQGSFVGFDLSGAKIEVLRLWMDFIDATGLRIPEGVRHVDFIWRPCETETRLTTDAALAPRVIGAWHSASACELLAWDIFTHSNQPIDHKVLKSRGFTVEGIGQRLRISSSDMWSCCGMIARRNQLRFNATPRKYALRSSRNTYDSN